MVAATPVAAAPLPAVDIPNVQFTAAGDDALSILEPLGSMIRIFNESSAQATKLADTFFEAPAAALQQIVVNQMDHVGALINDPTNVTDVVQSIGGNMQQVFATATFLGQEFGLDSASQALLGGSNDVFHSQLVGLLSLAGPALGLDDSIAQLAAVAASPASGVLMGIAGPFASPVVPFINPFMELASGGDAAASLQGLANAPLNAIDGFFNGSTLTLDPLAALLGETDILPDAFSLDGLSLAFGGLLTPGNTVDGAGGSLLNSLGFSLEALGVELEANGVGPLGALTGLSQMIAGALGWDGAGNPLTDLAFPALDWLNPESLLGGLPGLSLADFDLASFLPTDLFGRLDGLSGAFDLMMGIPQMLLELLTNAF